MINRLKVFVAAQGQSVSIGVLIFLLGTGLLLGFL
jgi:hypothetical protein